MPKADTSTGAYAPAMLIRKAGFAAPAQHVLLGLWSYAAPGRSCYPSLAELMETCAYSKPTVLKGISELERAHVLDIRHNLGRGHANYYVINFDALLERVKLVNPLALEKGKAGLPFNTIKGKAGDIKGKAGLPQVRKKYIDQENKAGYDKSPENLKAREQHRQEMEAMGIKPGKRTVNHK